MSRLFIEGFEGGHLNTNGFHAGNVFAVRAGTLEGTSGAYYGEWNWDAAARVDLPATKTEVYFACKYRRSSSYPGSTGFLQFWNGSNKLGAVIVIYADPFFYIRILRGAQNGTVLQTGTYPITSNTVHLVEVHYKPLNSGGQFRVKINGVLDIDYSGDTTNADESITSVTLHQVGVYTSNSVEYTDDIVMDDADWIGNTRIQKLQISGAGSTTQWDPSTGSNYQCVDELPYSDTDYVSTNTSNESDTYACADLVGNISSIKSLLIQTRMAYEGAPTPTKQKIAIRVNGTEYYGSDISPPLAFTGYSKLWEINPDDSQPWELADINAIEIGMRSVA